MAILVVVIANIWGKGMIRIIPIILGVTVSYAAAAVTGNVDFTAVKEAAWIGLPFHWDSTVFGILPRGGSVASHHGGGHDRSDRPGDDDRAYR